MENLERERRRRLRGEDPAPIDPPEERDPERGELVRRVGCGHAGALDIAIRCADETLRDLIAHDLVGYTLWARVTGGGAISVADGLSAFASTASGS